MAWPASPVFFIIIEIVAAANIDAILCSLLYFDVVSHFG